MQKPYELTFASLPQQPIDASSVLRLAENVKPT